MRNKIEFEFNAEAFKKNVVVFEVSPETILKEINKKMNSEAGFNEYLDLLKHCTNLTLDEITALYPSEKKFIFEKFKEVNSDFFLTLPKLKEAIDKIGIVNYLAEIIKDSGILDPLKKVIQKIIKESFNDQFASLLKRGTETHGNTDGDSLKNV